MRVSISNTSISGIKTGIVFVLISLTHWEILSFDNVTPLTFPLSSTPTYTVPPLALAKAQSDTMTSSLKEALNSTRSFSPSCIISIIF